ncbi:MAG: CPBP family intramembrane metalloprotease domain-containing protein [Erythrobacter sp.]|nr:CPBP family intramembrane metalloprotease domain-containing protein [Erythrobacter sp.]
MIALVSDPRHRLRVSGGIRMTNPLWRRIADFPLVALAIALLAVVGSTSGFGWLVEHLPDIGSQDASRTAKVIALIALLLIIYKFFIRHLGDAPHDDLPWHRASRELAQGTLLAFGLFSAIVAIAAALGSYRIVGWGGGEDFVMILFVAGFAAGFVEELMFRGVLFRWLEDFGGSWFALAVTSGLFGFAHISNDNATWLSSLAIALEAGILLGGAYMVTRSLWFAIGIHFGWNVTQGFIWDVPVSGNDVDGMVEAQLHGNELLSGGAFGLEASVIAMVVATSVGAYLVWLASQRGEIVRPWWVRRRLARQQPVAAIARD